MAISINLLRLFSIILCTLNVLNREKLADIMRAKIASVAISSASAKP